MLIIFLLLFNISVLRSVLMSDLLLKGLVVSLLLLGIVLLLPEPLGQVEGDQMVVDLVEVLVEEALDEGVEMMTT